MSDKPKVPFMGLTKSKFWHRVPHHIKNIMAFAPCAECKAQVAYTDSILQIVRQQVAPTEVAVLCTECSERFLKGDSLLIGFLNPETIAALNKVQAEKN